MDEPMGATLYRAPKLKQARALETRDGKVAASGAKVGKDFKVRVERLGPTSTTGC